MNARHEKIRTTCLAALFGAMLLGASGLPAFGQNPRLDIKNLEALSKKAYARRCVAKSPQRASQTVCWPGSAGCLCVKRDRGSAPSSLGRPSAGRPPCCAWPLRAAWRIGSSSNASAGKAK